MQLHYAEKWFHYAMSPLNPQNCLYDSCSALVSFRPVKTSGGVCSCLCDILSLCSGGAYRPLEVSLWKQKLAGNFGAFPGGLH